MRFLANENIPPSAIRLLREAGHDVLSIKETMIGSSDELVLARAVAENRVLVTFDKDFGELAFRWRLPASCGVVLFRTTPSTRDQDVQRVFQTLNSRTDWHGAFWTVTDRRIRRRPLPGGKS